MRIRDLTEDRTDEGPVWDKVKAGVKKMFTPAKRESPLVQSQSEVKRIFKKILNKEQLDQKDMSTINNLYRQI